MLVEKILLSVAETASLMGCSSWKVYQLIHSDSLQAFKDEGGRVWHIPTASILDYVETRMHTQALEK